MIEVPDPDRLRYEERMKRDAAAAREHREDANDDGRRKLNVVGDEEGHNHNNDIPVRTRLKPRVSETPMDGPRRATNRSRLKYEAEEVVFHLPPDAPNGPGKPNLLQ